MPESDSSPAEPGVSTRKQRRLVQAARQQLVTVGRASTDAYVLGMGRALVEAAVELLDLGEVAAARAELTAFLAAAAVVDESVAVAQRKLAEAEAVCSACGRPGTEVDPVVAVTNGHRVHRGHTVDPRSGYHGMEVTG